MSRDIHGLLDALRRAGIELWVDEDKLRYRAPPRALTPELRADIAAQRTEIVAHLKETVRPVQPVPAVCRRNRVDPVPLSWNQRRLWIIDQLAPGTATYNLPLAIRLSGSLDIAALESAVNAVLERHEVLRTTVGICDGVPMQIISAAKRISLKVCDVAARGEVKDWIVLAKEELHRPFDLTGGSLVRASLFRIAPDMHILLLCFHHLVADGWSLDIVNGEIIDVYAGKTLPDVSLQFADVVMWQSETLEPSESFAKQVEHWRERLQGAPEISTFPMDLPRPAIPTFRGATFRTQWSNELSNAIRAASRSAGATVFMTVLAAFQMFLARYTGQTDVCMGTAIANRSRRELETVVGFLANTLVLRANLTHSQTFAEFLAHTRLAALDAYSHQDVPFERLVEIIRPHRELNYQPMFQVMFALQPSPQEDRIARGVTFHREELESDVSPFDLTLSIADDGGAIRADWNYNIDLYASDTIRRMAEHFQVLLESAVRYARIPIAELPLLSPTQVVERLRLARGVTLAYSKHRGIAEVFQEQVAKNPDATALISGDEVLTYRELNARSNQVARQLRKLGIRRESIVALAMHRSIAAIVGVFAILKAGAAYVPIDPDYPSTRLHFILRDANAALVITQQKDVPKLTGQAVPVIGWEDIEAARSAFCADDFAPIAIADNLAYVIYTSGSTGQPKGVMVNQRGVVNLAAALAHFHGHLQKQLLLLAPLVFDSSIAGFFGQLLNGGSVNFPPREHEQDIPELATLIRRNCISAALLIPSVYGLLLEQPLQLLSSLEGIVVAAEACTGNLILRHRHRLPRATLHNEYGPTEATVACSGYDTANWQEESLVAIGLPYANMQVYVLDGNLGLSPVHFAGEIYIGGDGVANGYVNRPGLTAERFVPDPFGGSGARLFRTGDIGRMQTDGSLVFLGRKDNQVKVRGFRIELGEVEAAIQMVSAVQSVAVLAKRAEHGGMLLVAFVVAREGPALTSAMLERQLGNTLPPHMVPSVWVFLDVLPKLPNGKIDRKALEKVPLEQRAHSAEFHAPATSVEKTLANIWSQVLRRTNIGLHDNFFALGGDSIIAMQVVARARDAGWKLLPRQLFQHQTLAELASVAEPLRELVGTRAEPETSLIPLLPIQRWFFEQSLPQPHHWNQAMLLIPSEPLDLSRLTRAFDELCVRHEALRFRYVQTSSGWEQHRTDKPRSVHIEQVRLDNHHLAHLEAYCTKFQTTLDLASGHLFHVVHFDYGPGQTSRLLIVVHHLVIDGVSWRILLEDLQTALQQLQAGQSVIWPIATTPFSTWAARLLHVDVRDEVAYWENQPWSDVRVLPRDNPQGENRVGNASVVRRFLDEANTALLLTNVHHAYLTQINDILLGALAMALNAWMGDVPVAIDLEGHGREPLFDDIDLSRTIGWFTSVFPVILDLRTMQEPADVLQHIKHCLREIPRRGVGYGILRHVDQDPEIDATLTKVTAPEIAFNYLGQFDQVLSGERLFQTAPESTGQAFHAGGQRSHLIQIDAWIAEGRLQVEWTYSESIHRRETISHIADAFHNALRTLIGHCRTTFGCGYVPSEFPLAKLSQTSLNQIVGTRRDIEDIYPLTPSQQGLLFEALYENAVAGIYFQQLVWTFDAHFQPVAWRAAWNTLVSRHSSLRTSFVWSGVDEPLQVVTKNVAVPWEEVDWQGMTESDVSARLTEWLQVDRGRPFDLAQAPLLRFVLIRLPAHRFAVVWSFHHLLQDGWSLPLVLADVEALYRAELTQERPRLPVRRPFRDYVAWLARQEKSAHQSFWREELRGFGAATSFAVDRSASAKHLSAFNPLGEECVVFSELETQRLEAFVRDSRLTMSTLVQCAWGLLLGRYTGDDEVLFGATIAGRSANLPGIENMTGLFIQTIPVRMKFPRQGPARDWLQSSQQQLVELHQHDLVSLAELKTFSDLRQGEPLFESLVVFENYPFDANAGGQDLGLWNFQAHEQTHYPMTVFAEPGRSLRIRLSYQSARFASDVVRRVAAHLRTILQGLASEPNTSPRELAVLPPAEYDKIIHDFNQTRCEYPVGSSLSELIDRYAETTPHAIAVEYENRRLTYVELKDQSDQWAQRLRSLGVGPEVLVAVFLERSEMLLVALLAVLKAGGAYLPLDPIFPRERIRMICADAKPAVVLTQQTLREFFPTQEKHVVCLDGDSGESMLRLRHDKLPRVSWAHAAYVIYTSGSTGKPKGVRIPHDALLNFVHAMQDKLHIRSTDALLAVTTISFDIAGLEMFVPLIAGARVVIASRDTVMDGVALIQEMEKRSITLMQATPATWHLLFAAGWQGHANLRVLCGGEALPPELAERLRTQCAELWNMYGPTETTIWSTMARISSECPEVTIGSPIANTQAYILDENLRPVPLGVTGELYLGGNGLARDYFRRPGLTAERFIPDPWGSHKGARLYRTGDMARWLPDGRIECLGRRDNQIKLRGYRIELGEIEMALGRHPSVERVVVAAKDLPKLGLTLVAYVVAKGQAPSTNALRTHAAQTLPDYMVPTTVVLLDKLPQTPNGKVDRRALPNPSEQLAGARQTAAGRTPVEEMVASFWTEVLGVSQVERGDQFFELGGHSLLVTRLIARVRGVLRLEVPLRLIFDHPTLGEFVTALERYEKQPGQLLAMARAWQKMQRLSPDERKALLQRKPAST